jgi:flagellar hook protein FlgE
MMGLASALSTALTGMTGSETTIDVVGNNLANSNTVGFKSSTASFATQFLQTTSLGSGPTTYSGGTNPTQIGLGTMVADITPNFSQGTVSISSNPTDMAIQGDGFFIVNGSNGGYAYTRNGEFKLNAQNELTTVTGNRVLGYGVNDQFEVQTTALVPITIPLGSAEVAKATENVTLQGTLTPQGQVADAAKIIQTGVLGDGLYTDPTDLPTIAISGAKDTSGISFQPDAGGGSGNVGVGNYYYKFVLSDGDPGGSIPLEGTPSANMTTAVNVASAKSTVAITGFDTLLNASQKLDGYQQINIYRTDGTTDANGNYDFLGSVTETQANTQGFTFSDTFKTGGTTTPISLDEDVLNGQYQYYIAYGKSGSDPSRPIETLSLTPTNGRIHITDLPVPATNTNGWDSWIIYRNVPSKTGASGRFFQVGNAIPFNTTTPYLTDSTSDSTLYTDDTTHTAEVDLDGPKIQKSTLLSNVLQRSGSDYTNLFPSTGILQFTGHKAGGDLNPRNMTLTSTTTVGDLLTFMEESLGIQKSDATNGIPESLDLNQPSPPTYIAPGADVVDGKIRITGNNGVDNAIDVTSLAMVASSTLTNPISLTFNKYQDAEGQSTTTSTHVYDSLGMQCTLQLTAVLESSDSTATTYRWFADSQDNQTTSGSPNIAVGTGLIKFDGHGNFIGATQDQVSIYRSDVPSISPLQFKLDFSALSGLGTTTSSMQASAQDGFAPGTLTSYNVSETGLINGVFSNGQTRDLGQIRLARFGNSAGLEQLGQNMYAAGVNSGLPVQGNPGENGIGSIVSGAVELSNADVGGNLIDLILASTMYRSNTKVITTVQTMLDTLLQLER